MSGWTGAAVGGTTVSARTTVSVRTHIRLVRAEHVASHSHGQIICHEDRDHRHDAGVRRGVAAAMGRMTGQIETIIPI